MARADGFLAGGWLFLLSVVIAIWLQHAAGASLKPLDSSDGPWHPLGVEEEISILDNWSAGFGRRLSNAQRRQGPLLQQSEPPSVDPESKPKANVTTGLKSEASTVRLIRKRLPESRPAVNVTEQVVVNATTSNETVQPTPITEETPILRNTSVSTDEVKPTVAIPEEVVESVASVNMTIPSTTTTTSTTTVASTSVPAVDPVSSTTVGANKPLWRQRMELNQNHRRTKPVGNNDTSTESTTTTTVDPSSNKVDPKNATTVQASVPVVESSQTSAGPSLSSVVPVFSSTRPIQSSRISSSSSSSSSSGTWTPIVRLPLTGMRNIPSGTLKIQITTTRLPPVPVSDAKVLESLEEDNDVKQGQIFDSSSSSTIRSRTTTTTAIWTSSSSPTTTTTEPTTTTSTTTTRKTPPTPVLHSLEDILQRLVPARDDSFGTSPFLVAPVVRGVGQQTTSVVASTDDVNEIVSRQLPTGGSSSSGTRAIDNGSNANSSSGATNGNNRLTESTETHTTTSIYIVGVVAVIPLAGLVLWIVRVQLHKRRERLNESETSSETGFRKRLPPVALTPSKHARLFYGANDKEDLVSGSVSPGGYSGGGKTSPALKASPWEFTRSRLRLQTLIGEGNFGQVWKAEAEDICGCQGTLLVAVKTVKDGAAAKEKQELLREMKIMQQVGPHPNVVALLGCCTEQEPFLLIMEYVMYGRLLTFLRDHRTHQTYYNYSTDNEALTSRDLTTFAYCVAKGMEFIYSKGVVHRDLAARNVLVDHNKLCKVADFGLSRSVRDTAGEMYEQRVKGALPIRWMAPESLIQSVFTQKSDVWSFGILVWEIVTLGSTPYPGMEAREVMRRVKDGHRLERPSHCRSEFYRLMSRCWHSDPQRRPDFGELKSELGKLLDNADGYIDLDNFQESIYVPLQSPSDESEKI